MYLYLCKNDLSFLWNLNIMGRCILCGDCTQEICNGSDRKMTHKWPYLLSRFSCCSHVEVWERGGVRKMETLQKPMNAWQSWHLLSQLPHWGWPWDSPQRGSVSRQHKHILKHTCLECLLSLSLGGHNIASLWGFPCDKGKKQRFRFSKGKRVLCFILV